MVDLVRLVIEAYGLELEEVEIKLKENNTSKKGIYDYGTLSRNSKQSVKEMFLKLDEAISNLDGDIEKSYTKHYIAYRKGQNFMEVHFHVDWLTIYMFPNAQYDDPDKKVEYLNDRTWTLTARIYVRPEDNIEYITKLIKASYEVL